MSLLFVVVLALQSYFGEWFAHGGDRASFAGLVPPGALPVDLIVVHIVPDVTDSPVL